MFSFVHLAFDHVDNHSVIIVYDLPMQEETEKEEEHKEPTETTDTHTETTTELHTQVKEKEKDSDQRGGEEAIFLTDVVTEEKKTKVISFVIKYGKCIFVILFFRYDDNMGKILHFQIIN